MKNKRWMLETQLKTGRTCTGRRIGEQLFPVIENAMNNLDVESARMAECLNCHFIIDDEYFYDGCKNCGGKDIKEQDARKKVTKE